MLFPFLFSPTGEEPPCRAGRWASSSSAWWPCFISAQHLSKMEGGGRDSVREINKSNFWKLKQTTQLFAIASCGWHHCTWLLFFYSEHLPAGLVSSRKIFEGLLSLATSIYARKAFLSILTVVTLSTGFQMTHAQAPEAVMEPATQHLSAPVEGALMVDHAPVDLESVAHVKRTFGHCLMWLWSCFILFTFFYKKTF